MHWAMALMPGSLAVAMLNLLFLGMMLFMEHSDPGHRAALSDRSGQTSKEEIAGSY